jgi:hypothetical protein
MSLRLPGFADWSKAGVVGILLANPVCPSSGYASPVATI